MRYYSVFCQSGSHGLKIKRNLTLATACGGRTEAVLSIVFIHFRGKYCSILNETHALTYLLKAKAVGSGV